MPEHVTEQQWANARVRESETATHPCDHWNQVQCMCKGACSCHWVQWPERARSRAEQCTHVAGAGSLCRGTRCVLKVHSKGAHLHGSDPFDAPAQKAAAAVRKALGPSNG